MNWEEFKSKFGGNLSHLGYGALKEESNTDFSEIVTTRSKYDYFVSSTITSLLMQAIIPWIDYVFHKYTEEQFHVKMTNGFDFIQDWKENHPQRYGAILKAVRTIRSKIIVDEDKFLQVVLKEVNKRGWKLTDWEKGRFRENIAVFISEIYS